jgi:hypothetical protein
VLNESPDGAVRVCEHCLQAGHIDERLAMHAQQLEEQAQKTRSLIGRVKVPTYEEWLAEERVMQSASRRVKNHTSDSERLRTWRVADRYVPGRVWTGSFAAQSLSGAPSSPSARSTVTRTAKPFFSGSRSFSGWTRRFHTSS